MTAARCVSHAGLRFREAISKEPNIHGRSNDSKSSAGYKSNYKNSKVTDLIVMVANKVHSASNSSDTNIRNNNGQIMGSTE